MKQIAISAVTISLQLAFVAVVAVGLVVSFPYVQNFVARVMMPPKDAAFVKEHPIIFYGAEANYPPMIYLEDGHLTGISINTIREIERKTGIKFSATKVAPLADLMASFKQSEIELITSLTPTPDRKQFMTFSDPYVTIGTHLLYVKPEVKRVGVGNEFGVVSWLRDKYPQWTLVYFPDDETSMKALINGSIDGAVMDSASAAYLMDTLSKTFNSEPLEFKYQLSFGLSKNNAELERFLNSTLERIKQSK